MRKWNLNISQANTCLDSQTHFKFIFACTAKSLGSESPLAAKFASEFTKLESRPRERVKSYEPELREKLEVGVEISGGVDRVRRYFGIFKRFVLLSAFSKKFYLCSFFLSFAFLLVPTCCVWWWWWKAEIRCVEARWRYLAKL